MSTVDLDLTRDAPVLDPAVLRERARLALNKTITATRTQVIRRTTQTYRLTERQLQPYVTARRVSTNAETLQGSVDLALKPLPIELFKPRVVMRQVTYLWRGHTVTRRLASIELQRFVNGAPKLVGPAFPLHQRRTGQLRRDDSVRRRIGPDRDRLTTLRYYTFPKRFVQEELLPVVRAFVPDRFRVELEAARRVTVNRRSGFRREIRL